MRCCSRKHCSLCLITVGFALTVAVAVCVGLGAFDRFIKNTIQKNLEIKKGSESYKNWKSPSSQIYMQYFMFNLTNPIDVKNGSKPSVKQIGPYSYREIRHKVPRYFNNSIDSIAYYSQKSYVFDSATSCAGCDPLVDKVYTINIPLLKISQLIGDGLKFLPKSDILLIKEPINNFLKKEKLFPARSIHELLWGYDDFFLDSLANLTALINEQLKKHGFKLHIPPVNPFVKLQTNNSNTSAEIHTGVGNINRLGQYVSYKNFRILPWWNTTWANMINGTDASMFRPDISKNDNLQTFVSDVCRSLYLQYYSTVEVQGITLYRFFTPSKLFNYTADVRAGFCVPKNGTCVPNGLLDISVCQPLNVPIVVSLPHFLFADPSVINSVDGMHPNKENHLTFVSVEPNTGITMKAKKRIQINVAVDKVDGIDQLEKIRKVYLPVLFVNESGTISKDDAEKFKKDVILPIEIVYYGKYVLIGIGCLLFVIGLVLYVVGIKQKGVSHTGPTVQVYNEDDDDKSPLMRQPENYVT